MILWRKDHPDGTIIVGCGLEGGNVTKLKKGEPIFRRLDLIGMGQVAVCIHYGETKDDMIAEMGKFGIATNEVVPEPGPTGAFPKGKARPDDEGELRAVMARQGDNVTIDFGKSITWLSMSAHEAKEFAARLLKMSEGTRDN